MRRLRAMSVLALAALGHAPSVRAVRAGARLGQPLHVVIEVGPNETVADAARRRSDLFEAVRDLPDGSVLLASRGLADVITFERVEYQPHDVPLSALIPRPASVRKPRRRSKRAQRARRTIWTTTSGCI